MSPIRHSFTSPSPMASEKIRKRAIGHDFLQKDHLTKKRKSTSAQALAPKSPPAFYDDLSKVPLTLNVLLELDRRNDALSNTETRTSSIGPVPKNLSRYSRRGGPDMRHLRDFSSKTRIHPTMENTQSSSRSRQTHFTKATSVISRSGSSRYGKEFDQHLRDYGVYMNNRKSKALNMDETRISLEQSRASLSPSQFTEEQFETFQRKNEDVVFESDVMADVIPIISGSSRIPSKQNALFTELEPLTSRNVVRPKPDHFDGADLADLCVEVRKDDKVRQRVIPTKHPSVPVAANFFIEAKGPNGNASVAQRQACYSGAYGARAMHTLQNYGKPSDSYDGNAYTYSSTYHPATGTLQLYAHHTTAPTGPGARPEYHMTQIDTWGMTGNIHTYRRGATAFRNARDLAQRYRDQFIHAANPRHASQDGQQDDEDGPSAQNFLKEQTAKACDESVGENVEVLDASQSCVPPNSSQASTILAAAEDQDLSFVTSFTSSSGNGLPVGSKRTRQLVSPHDSLGRSSYKSQTRTNISELEELSKRNKRG
ncbi:uncharacterized protein MAM_06111 [Metarhizium album ARSEF 1941]|uniref:Uncharacterized protein n=1 Tax=Metarhizium album (strain ARSEF 1941) TaxID=1081103 RepID=A0A0B2WIY0_METAS|nr:uncharacterized protein MAM_06111 [Metarhizium album ARSEF 1941]KHN96006.1 hypothetical protein MAM_06111 [Metarhizium album ARSEF 1941]